jgi:hypothetical protein
MRDLAKLGAQGWELVLPYTDSGDTAGLILKRPIEVKEVSLRSLYGCSTGKPAR